MGKPTERILVFIFGVVFVVVMLIMAVWFPEPKPFQYTVFRIVLALAAAGIASLIPGFLNVEVGPAIKAGGAIAVFVIVYFFTPAQLVAEKPDPKSKAIDQLGSDKVDVRIGAIYSLEQIAKDSRADHWSVMELLTAYVRNNSPWQKDKISGAAQEKCKKIAGDVENME